MNLADPPHRTSCLLLFFTLDFLHVTIGITCLSGLHCHKILCRIIFESSQAFK